jgi:aminoglycoside/choline kinase family phosphotransferase
MNRLTELYTAYAGKAPAGITPLPGAGSNRKYYRLTTGEGTTLIGVVGTSREENDAFRAIAAQMHGRGLHVPRVVAATEDGMCYLQTDLGDTSLYSRIEACRNSGTWDTETVALLRRTMSDLADLQQLGARGFDFSVCYPRPEFDRRSVMWDLNHFKYYFLKPSGVDFQESLLEDDFERLAEMLLEPSAEGFLYRDFQSRNVMIHEGTPYYIDFQGGRRGPVFYDVASFLWQARAGYPEALREELIGCYLQSLGKYLTLSEAEFRRRLDLFVLFRLMQVLGTYGLRGYVERKALFIVSIPQAVDLLRGVLERHPVAECPHLIAALERMVALPQYALPVKREGLTVRVVSFSYRKGVPDDPTGNGGGFVFDCRALHNPGRYEPYKKLTGEDSAVIEFLERESEVGPFLEHVYGLVDAAVERYRKRGFESLMVCFGCTGGQHRSVYTARHTAEHVARKFGVRVRLEHREQGIVREF